MNISSFLPHVTTVQQKILTNEKFDEFDDFGNVNI